MKLKTEKIVEENQENQMLLQSLEESIKKILLLSVFYFDKDMVHFLHKRDYNENSQNGISFLL